MCLLSQWVCTCVPFPRAAAVGSHQQGNAGQEGATSLVSAFSSASLALSCVDVGKVVSWQSYELPSLRPSKPPSGRTCCSHGRHPQAMMWGRLVPARWGCCLFLARTAPAPLQAVLCGDILHRFTYRHPPPSPHQQQQGLGGDDRSARVPSGLPSHGQPERVGGTGQGCSCRVPAPHCSFVTSPLLCVPRTCAHMFGVLS